MKIRKIWFTSKKWKDMPWELNKVKLIYKWKTMLLGMEVLYKVCQLVNLFKVKLVWPQFNTSLFLMRHNKMTMQQASIYQLWRLIIRLWQTIKSNHQLLS